MLIHIDFIGDFIDLSFMSLEYCSLENKRPFYTYRIIHRMFLQFPLCYIYPNVHYIPVPEQSLPCFHLNYPAYHKLNHQNMNSTTVYIHNYVKAVHFIFMYHKITPFNKNTVRNYALLSFQNNSMRNN